MDEILDILALEIGYPMKGARGTSLLPPIHASLFPGDFVALSGPNGAGKTTLFRTLTAAIPALSGKISFAGKPLNQYSSREKAALYSVVLTERLDDHFMRVFDIVSTGRYPFTGWYARLSQSDHQLIEQSMQRVGIQSLSDRTFVSLSDGERQKVLIAKALAQNTPIIFLDEPTAFLDFPSKLELMHLLQKLAHEDRKTILFSSHDLELILRSADKIWLIAKNLPLLQGIPEDLVLANAMNQYFGRNNLNFDLRSGHFKENTAFCGQIGLLNDSVQAHWLGRALLRMGYEVIENQQTEISVKARNQQFELDSNGNKKMFNTIENLLYALQKLS